MFECAFLHNASQRALFFQNLLPRFGREAGQVNLYRAELDRFVRAVEEQHHFAEILVARPAAAQQAEMDVATVKFFQRRGHIVVVHEQSPVGLRHRHAIHLLHGRQSQAHLRVERVQGMRQRELPGRFPRGGR